MTSLSHITVKPILESLEHLLTNHSSLARFGDGEIDIMTGHSIPYQDYDKELASRLKTLLMTPSSERFLVCLPDVFQNLERYNANARYFWERHFEKYQDFYLQHCQSAWYGSTFLSRPYIDLEDKSLSATYFDRIRQLWQDRELLIVEGETTRSGLGNDLFSNSKAISRIICPSKNAYSYYDDILKTILKHANDKLIILMLGPTAKLLAEDLAHAGHQAIDLGHLDSEYEWFNMKATHKVKFAHKHTAEHNYDTNITPLTDQTYLKEIVARVGIDSGEKTLSSPKQQNELISVIIPVYNVKPYLKRCLDSVLKQTYDHIEVLLINDGSTDGSALICQEYAKKDSRIRLFHQENAGVSAARNLALEKATGDYITFVDSDDFIEGTYLEDLHKSLIKNEADIAVCNFTSFNEKRQSFLFSVRKEDYFETTYSTQEWLDQETVARFNMYLVFTFSPLKLFKRALFDQIYFPLNRTREDDATIYKLYLKANRIAYINQGTYYYSQREDSLSRSVMTDDIAGMISNAEERIALLASLGYDVSKHITSYVKRLEKCQNDALTKGQVELYRQISTKLNLYQQYQRKDS
ncbi:SP_1767 family glycosyltransferase [Streptococcus plurextorum]|uniref:SP_1767 family glycosyltransferase n=1 Tax=Streptococcus plurextorum TaxID=456876 RepID=UPI000416500F|nr:SP_1767 family glycosyltransferase [Streptococcus plurextorum]